MSKEATVEPGQATYEAWCTAAKITAEWSRLPRYAVDYWAAAEQAAYAAGLANRDERCLQSDMQRIRERLAAERAWDEGYTACGFYPEHGAPVNPYRQPPKGDGDGG